MKKGWSLVVCAFVLSAAIYCSEAKAQTYDDGFSMNDIVISGELYVWNRIADLLDIFRVGVAAGADLGFDVAATEYIQLGAMVTKERGVDFPHFVPPLWLTHFYQKKTIFRIHEGYCATAAIGPWRAESSDKEDGKASFERAKWDLRLELAVLAHVYVDFSAKEIGDFFVGFVGWDLSDDDEKVDPSENRRPADQFGRSICNILFGAFEIPSNIIRVNDAEGDLPGATKGVGLGVWRFLCREVVGVVELVTFPFGWSPIIEPEYSWQEVKDTDWKIHRPRFHKTY